MNPDKTALKEIKRHIAVAQAESPLASPHTIIIGASKGQSADRIAAMLEAGLMECGENRVQEAESKWPALKRRFPHVRLRLIGHLQTNKVREALALFDSIDTLDSIKLAEALRKEMDVRGRDTPCLIQVNTGAEPQKAGILPEDADQFIDDCINRLHLPIKGLMCIPPADAYPAPHFALLKKIADRHGLRDVSMGMSSDFETAVRLGATHIRLGTVLFGERVT